MTRYEPYCDCLGGHVSMVPDPNGRWFRADDPSGIVHQMPLGGEYALKPCPFCDGLSTMEGAGGDMWIECDACGACTAYQDSDHDAISAWNRRAAPTDNTALVEALRELTKQGLKTWNLGAQTGPHWVHLGAAVSKAGRLLAALASREAPPAAQEPVAQRCAECDCENGGKECTWIKWTKPEPACQQEAVTESDLAAARAEIERLTKERDREALTREGILQKRINDLLARAEKAETERDAAMALLADAYGAGTGGSVIESHLADAERDMRQRAAELVGQEARTFPDHVAWGVEDLAKAILALPISIESDDAGNGDVNA